MREHLFTGFFSRRISNMGSKILKLLLSSWSSFFFQVFDFEEYVYLFMSSYLIYPKTNNEKLQEEVLNVPTITKYPKISTLL